MTRFLIYRSADAQELPCGCAARDKRRALTIARRMFRLDRTAYAMKEAA